MDEGEQLRNWLNGDEAAALLVEKLFALSQIADDFVDDDQEINRNKAMCKLLHIAIVEIPSNPAWLQYQNWLLPLISSSIITWGTSNELANDDDEDSRRFAWAIRDIAEQLVHQVALLKNGFDYAQRIAAEVARYYRTNEDKETFEQWQEGLKNEWRRKI